MPNPLMTLIVPRLLPKNAGDDRLAEGFVNWGVLNRLKNSARNSTSCLSLMRNFRNTEKSKLKAAGPRSMSRPDVPALPVTGGANAAGFT